MADKLGLYIVIGTVLPKLNPETEYGMTDVPIRDKALLPPLPIIKLKVLNNLLNVFDIDEVFDLFD